MKKNFFQKKIYLQILISFAIFFSFQTQITFADSINVNLNVTGCNNNYICEAGIGENLLSCPNDCVAVVPSNTSSVIGSVKKIRITIDSQTVTDSTIKILWTSTIPVNASVTWISEDGKMGAIQEIGFTKNHSLYITNLKSKTRYTINIEARDLYGNVKSETIKISTLENLVSPPLIKNFNIEKQNQGAVLVWQNPSTDFDYVRIVKSDTFFPQDPYDGEVIYEGSAQSFFDSEIKKDVRYYYSIFVKDSSGFSTGVIDNFVYKTEQELFTNVGQQITSFGPIVDHTNIFNLNESPIQNQIHFYQDNNELTQVNNTYSVENGKDILIKVRLENVSSDDVDMYLSYFNSSIKSKSKNYIFKYDSTQKEFSTQFTISNNEPNSSFILYIRNNQKIKGYLGYFSTSVRPVDTHKNFWSTLISNDLISSIILTFIFILLLNFLWVILLFRAQKDEEK